METRLGLNVHRDAWPTAPDLTAHAAAGFAWVQVHTPPRPTLCDRRLGLRHARGLRASLDGTGLRLLLHAPDDLSAGTLEHDRAFEGLLDYAATAGAELIAYHGLNFVEADGPAAARPHERAHLEERSLTPLLQRALSLGVTVAIENLAPVYPGARRRRCHDPLAVRDLVRRLDHPSAALPRARQSRLPPPDRRAGDRPGQARPAPAARPRLAAVNAARRDARRPRRPADARGRALPPPSSRDARRGHDAPAVGRRRHPRRLSARRR